MSQYYQQVQQQLNDIKNWYDLSWHYDCDLLSIANVVWSDNNGTVIAVTSGKLDHCPVSLETLKRAVEVYKLKRRLLFPPIKVAIKQATLSDIRPEDVDPDELVLILDDPDHPGSFGAHRKHHRHEGIDLYCLDHEEIFSMSSGVVVEVIPHFTGAECGSPWWNSTSALMIEDDNGVWLYGEIQLEGHPKVGDAIEAGDLIGAVLPVLKVDKGRPMSMLHLERYTKETTKHLDSWDLDMEQPSNLIDPTPELIAGLMV